MGRKSNNYVKTHTVYQMEAAECGAACLAMVFGYHGLELSLEQLRADTGVSRDGCVAGNIVRAARKYGFDSHGYKREPEQLKNIVPPCILYWENDHFVVFEGFKGDSAYINDPACGRRKLSAEELKESFAGVVLTFSPPRGFNGRTDNRFSRRSVFGVNRDRAAELGIDGEHKYVIALAAFGIGLAAPAVLFSVITGCFVDIVLRSGDASVTPALIAAALSSSMIGALLVYVLLRLMGLLRKKYTLTVSRKIVGKLFRLPLDFFEQRFAGELAGRPGDVEKICAYMAGDAAEIFTGLVTGLICIPAAFIASPLPAAAGTVLLIAEVAFGTVRALTVSGPEQKYRQEMGKYGDALYSGLLMNETLRAMGAENDYAGKLLGYDESASNARQKADRAAFITETVRSIITAVNFLILTAAGVAMISRNMINPGRYIGFMLIFAIAACLFRRLPELVKSHRALGAYIAGVNDILTAREDGRFDPAQEGLDGAAGQNPAVMEMMGLSGSRSWKKLTGNLELRNITYSYGTLREPILSDVSFAVESGTMLAVAGPSGAGKTTLTKIISGLYQPLSGEVLFDGIPARKIPPEVFCASVCIAGQSDSLFSGTIRDNITMWNGNVREADMIAAAKDACIHDFITGLGGAYGHMLGENGSNLSEGERQRLLIARALATNPSVLILDETTGAIEPETERKILDNIRRRGCTLIAVAQRRSVIDACDRVIRIGEGEADQNGNE